MTKTRIPNVFAVPVIVLLALIVATAPASAQTFSDLYNFGINSGDPLEPLYPGIIAQGRDGSLYSTSSFGGALGGGSVFRITPDGVLNVLYSFDGAHGLNPISGLTLGADGDFYGTTTSGGASGFGVVFKITSGGVLTILHNFTNGTDGEYPYAPPIQGADGSFYGTTFGGGASNLGTVYKITSSGTLTTIYQLNAASGGNSYAPFIQGADGNFYVATQTGGKIGQGTIFKISSKGTLRVIHSFGQLKGNGVFGALVQDSKGYFYGAATAGGSGSGRRGTIFRITTGGKVTVLHDFDRTGAATPIAGLTQAPDGNFYGAASKGGQDGAGMLYRITPRGGFSILYRFDQAEGATPQVTLLNHTSGMLYGQTFEGGLLSDCSGHGCGVFYSLRVGVGPFVSLVTAAGKVGKTIEILGQGFTGTTAVSFNGTSAGFVIKSDTYLTAVVPSGATTGFVTVNTPDRMLKSNKPFTVKP
jgi:uncharacterized repeat protein (TIGR03803 family)